METLCRELLKEWCESLLKLQISGTGNPGLDGAMLCPACGRIHGRCFEAAYPFLSMAALTGDEKWILSAGKLYDWAEYTLSQEDGSYLNDIDSGWKGTTVFNLTQMADCLLFHGERMPESMKKQWKARMGRGAEFLLCYEELRENNINYPIAESLAMYELGIVLEEKRYIREAERLAAMAEQVMTMSGLVFGEGVPRCKKSPRDCQPVDIGYNVEETLPALALYGVMSKDEKVSRLARESMKAHLDFALPDGGWDNSFGTRNFKWTYWGSRTSDGCALGYLLFAEEEPELARAAERNLRLLRASTADGLLAGGPHYKAAGQRICVHHTFTHAKVLAGVLDRGLARAGKRKGRKTEKKTAIRHYPETDTVVMNRHGFRATVTAYDWEYVTGGHVSGGTLSLLHHFAAGPLLCAGMGQYTRYEAPNMQTPRGARHECLALRIEAWENGVLYSSIYENRGQMEILGDNEVEVRGNLKNIRHEDAPDIWLPYCVRYCLTDEGMTVKARFAVGILICPLISESGEETIVSRETGEVKIYRGRTKIRLKTEGTLELPYGTERIFNLSPGFQALRIEMKPMRGAVKFSLQIR